MNIFGNFQSEEPIIILKKFKKVIDGTGTTNVSGRTNYLRKMLRGEALQEFDELAS